MTKKIELLPLTFEALNPAAEASAGKATRWTASWSDIVAYADLLEERRAALRLSKKDCIGIEGIYLTDTPQSKSYARKSRAVNGSQVTYRYTRDGWKVMKIERVERPCGQSATAQLVVSEALIPEIQKRATAHLIVRKAA
jgi:hypothetical protein